MRKSIHTHLIFALLALWPAVAGAQYVVCDSVRLPRWEPHLSVTTGFLGTGQGDSRLFTTVAPSVTFCPTSRWRLTGGFGLTADFGLNGHYMAAPERNLAPVRNGGTRMASAYVEAEYQVSDRLWLAASLHHIGGDYAPLFGPANGTAMPISATALSAEAAYRFEGGSLLHLSITVVRDHAGTLPYLWWENWHMGGWGGYDRWNGYGGWNGMNGWNGYNGWF